MLAAISHPGIVSIFDVEPGDPATGRDPFFVMELCPDGSLADELGAAGGRLPPDTVVRIVGEVAGGLAALHRRGIVHRDVKPHNILLTPGGAKLADFGVARAAETTQFTAPGTAVGTLAYLAPELLSGAAADPASDVYSLGVVTFQALTGRLPRSSNSMVDLVDGRETPVLPVSAVSPDLAAFDAPVALALGIDPASRPGATAFAASLGPALARWRATAGPRARGGTAIRGVPAGAARGRAQARGAAAGGAAGAALGAAGATAGRSGVRPGPGSLPSADARTVAVRVGRRQTGRSTPQRWPIAVIALLVVAAVVAAALVAGNLGGHGSTATPSPVTSASPSPSASPSVEPSASPSPSASSSPSPSPSPSVPPTPAPTPTPVVTAPPATPVPTLFVPFNAAQARADASNVTTAIQSAAPQELSGQEAPVLQRQLAAVVQAIDNNDPNAAANAADTLVAQVDQYVNAGKIAARGEPANAVIKLRQDLPAG